MRYSELSIGERKAMSIYYQLQCLVLGKRMFDKEVMHRKYIDTGTLKVLNFIRNSSELECFFGNLKARIVFFDLPSSIFIKRFYVGLRCEPPDGRATLRLCRLWFLHRNPKFKEIVQSAFPAGREGVQLWGSDPHQEREGTKFMFTATHNICHKFHENGEEDLEVAGMSIFLIGSNAQ